MFQEKSYDQKQALEILPLIIAYRSNLLASAEGLDKIYQFQRQNDARSVEFFLQREVEKMAHPEPPPQAAPAVQPPPQPVLATAPTPARLANPLKPEQTEQPLSTNILTVEKYLPVPLDEFSAGDMSGINITSHHWVDGKLVLDLRYDGQVVVLNDKGFLQSSHNVTQPGVAILDPATEHWQVIPGPPTDPRVWYNPVFYHRTTLWHGEPVTSFNDKVKKYDSSKKSWQDLDLPDIGNCELFTVGDRLFAANYNLIVEILQGGGTRTLASNRRQPPVSALDSEKLGTPVVFPGPRGTLRVATADKVFSGDDANWIQICTLPNAPASSVISDENVLFSGGGWSYLWRLAADSEQPDLCLGRIPDNNRMAADPFTKKNLKPLWQTPKDVVIGRMPAASRGDQLWLLTDHSKSEDIVNQQQHLIIGKKILPTDGYHAELCCFSKNYALPQKVRLKFGATDERVSLRGNPGYSPPGTPAGWLCTGGGNMYAGLESPDTIPSANEQEIGVWIIPLDRLDAEVARQKKMQDVQVARDTAANKSLVQSLLSKYDSNRDGVIDADEKEAALGDESFIAGQLDQIHTNASAFLAARELKYFDANTNNILDANEQAGIDIAHHLLAGRLLRKFDADGNGLIDRPEARRLVDESFDQMARNQMGNSFPDNNRDNWLDVDEVGMMLKGQTQRSLFIPGLPPRFGEMSESPAQRYKKMVEDFWEGDGKPTERMIRRNLTPPGMSPGYPQFSPRNFPNQASNHLK